MTTIQVMIGSVNGRTLQTGGVVAHLLNKLGHSAWINEEPTPADLRRDPEEILLVCTCTTGEGQLPRNLYPLYLALEDQRVALPGRQYGIISLGDSGYRLFAQAGFTLEAALHLSGARRLREIYTIDSKTTPNQPLAAAQWVQQWALQHLAAPIPQPV
jgi:flavodoxin